MSEVLHAEINSISEEDCIAYIRNLVIERTFNGFQTEIVTIYEQLQVLVERPIEPAPDEWDRGFNVDFFIQVGQSFIGLQIKPETFERAQNAHLWRDVQNQTHLKFKEQFGGKVFTVVSTKQNDRKIIANPQVVPEIQAEIQRLLQKEIS